VQRIVDKNYQWQDQSKQNKVSLGGEAFFIIGSYSKFLKEEGMSDLLVDKKNAQKRRTNLRHHIQSSLDHEEPAHSLKCKEKRAQKIPKEGAIHLQVGHMVKDHHVTDWKVKGTGFPNLLNSRYVKSRNYLSRQFEVCSGLLI
jgi:hypothetical protein